MTRVNAYDLGSPPMNSSDYTIVMNVLRNLYAPEFLNAPYTIRVHRSTVVNSNVGQVFVRDRDTFSPYNQWTLTTTGDNGATTFFGVRSNGALFIRNSLVNAPDEVYL